MSKNQDSNLDLNFKLFQTYFEDYVPTGAEKSDKIYTQRHESLVS